MGWRVDNELQQMLRDSARGYLGQAAGATHFRKVRQSAEGFAADAWSQMAALGWTGVLLPESHGGAELGLEPALTLAEEMGRAIAPEPFVSASIIAATILGQSNGGAAKMMAEQLVGGEATVTLAWQERSGHIGLPEFATQLTAGKLTGRKVHVPAWHNGTALLVAAAGDEGPVVIAVDPSADGVAVASNRATDGSFSADITFTDVAVPDEDLILSGDEALAALELALARGTLALSAQLEGLAGALWHMTADYMKQRAQFGTRLADYQALRHRMVDLYAEIELAAASWRYAARVMEAQGAGGYAVHTAKARCSQAAQDMSRWAIQYHGAFGYTDEADIGLFVHCALRWATWLGNATAHRRAALAAHRNGTSAYD